MKIPTAVIQAASLEYVVTTAADAVVDQKTTGRSNANDHFFIVLPPLPDEFCESCGVTKADFVPERKCSHSTITWPPLRPGHATVWKQPRRASTYLKIQPN